MKPNSVCNNLSFNECELSILRMAVDKADEKISRRTVNSPDIKNIITIVENFIKRKNVVCYGGTAINNILPESDQFYNKDVEIPDYDFFTPNALNDAKELADLYYSQGFIDVEAKSGQHHGTYKVFVNYIPVADITYLNKEIFNVLKKDAIRVAGILYAPPNFLRMAMYLELSRPAGDTSRWEKVLKRLLLLNKNYPLKLKKCQHIEFQREMENKSREDDIYNNVKNTLINQGVVFFGGFAISLYSQYMPRHLRHKLRNIADFDVLSNEPDTTAEIVKERLKDINIKNVTVHKKVPIGEIIPLHYEIKVGNDTVAFVYKPIACHSYNVINVHGSKVKIATIDTMLSFYLAFIYTNRPYYQQFFDRIICMSQFLFEVQQKNRLAQKGLLKRFSINCYGHQESVEEIRAHKSEKFKELKNNRNSIEFEEWFLNYKPDDKKNKKTSTSTSTSTSSSNTKTKKRGNNKTKRANKQSKKRSTKRNIMSLIYGNNKKKY
jgi:hypothetical protein